ncbi:MAG: hypothetical protein IPP85_00285 [Propionivibrio sp.]|nr:hypothetical protein [Propionivibrio sp.]
MRLAQARRAGRGGGGGGGGVRHCGSGHRPAPTRWPRAGAAHHAQGHRGWG